MLTELLHMHVYDEKFLITSRMHTAHDICKAVAGLATFSARIVIYLMLIRRAGT